MKIKAADIARNLNLSKATVSLVLNNKPGVSEKTRRKDFDYIEEVTGEAERQKEEKGACCTGERYPVGTCKKILRLSNVKHNNI